MAMEIWSPAKIDKSEGTCSFTRDSNRGRYLNGRYRKLERTTKTESERERSQESTPGIEPPPPTLKERSICAARIS